MNKKANSPLSVLGTFFVFNLIWVFWLAKFLNTNSARWIAEGKYIGFDAFIISNLNMVIFIIQIMAISLYLYFGGGE